MHKGGKYINYAVYMQIMRFIPRAGKGEEESINKKKCDLLQP